MDLLPPYSPASVSSYRHNAIYPTTCQYEYNTNYSQQTTPSSMLPQPQSSLAPPPYATVSVLYSNHEASTSEEDYNLANGNDSVILPITLLEQQQNLFSCQYAQQQSSTKGSNINERLQTTPDNRSSQYIDFDYNNNNNNINSDNDKNINISQEQDRTDATADINTGHNSVIFSTANAASLPSTKDKSLSPSKTTLTRMPPLDMKGVIETLATLKSNGQMRKSDTEEEEIVNNREKGEKKFVKFDLNKDCFNLVTIHY